MFVVVTSSLRGARWWLYVMVFIAYMQVRTTLHARRILGTPPNFGIEQYSLSVASLLRCTSPVVYAHLRLKWMKGTLLWSGTRTRVLLYSVVLVLHHNDWRSASNNNVGRQDPMERGSHQMSHAK